MLFSNCAAQRAVAYGIAAGATVGAVLFGAAPAAIADPPAPEPAPLPPGCTAADFAQVAAGVAAATSAYLFTHPDVNAYFTSLKGQQREDLRGEMENYLDANPAVGADLRGIRQPLTDLRNRCQ